MKNVSVDIKDDVSDKSILKDVSLEFQSGKIYVITGPNRGGKSTLA